MSTTPYKDKFQQSVDFYLHGITPTIEIYEQEYFKRLIRNKIKYAVTSKEKKIKHANLSHERTILLLKKLAKIKNFKIS